MRALALLLLMAGCRAATPKAPPGPVTLIATAELHGTTEPCGCTSDPLGDLARVAALAKGGLLLDAGDLTYETGGPPATRKVQAEQKASAIANVYRDADVALGPSDLANGVDRVAPARQACNLPAGFQMPLATPRVREINGLRIGIIGVSDVAQLKEANPTLTWPSSPRPQDTPAERARFGVQQLERPDVVVALLAMKRSDAQALMEAVPEIDFGIIGADVEEGLQGAVPAGHGWLVAPADQGRRVAKLVVARGDAPPGRLKLTAFDGPSGQARELAKLDRRKADLTTQLATWKADTTADPTFIAARQAELDRVIADRGALAAKKPVPPTGPWFTYELVPVKRALPRDPEVAAEMHALDRAIGKANLASAPTTPPPAEAGTPTYVGSEQCARCHKPATAFWQKTRHAQAWKTLVDVDKQYNYDCIGCHVTGWQEPGGSSLGTVEKQKLVDVQCEVCHGPGSKHVEEAGLDDPKTMHAPSDGLCASRCHTPEHSDTFALEPYLRDVLGAGHGEQRRKAIGEGPTAHELRKTASAMAQ